MILCEVHGCTKSSNAALNGVWLCADHFNEKLDQMRDDHIRKSLFNGLKEDGC